MKKKILTLIFKGIILICYSYSIKGQQVGASYSYFLPNKGYFSMPVSPISFRDFGLDFGKNFSLTTGITLYRFSGMHVAGLPFEINKPLLGPFFSVLVPASLKFSIHAGKLKFELKGGMFAFYNFDYHVIYGSFNKPMAEYKGWDIVSADLKLDSKLGYGIKTGASVTYYVKEKVGIVLGANYFDGEAPLNLRGTISGGIIGNSLQQEAVNFPDSKLDFSGFEIKVGVDYNM